MCYRNFKSLVCIQADFQSIYFNIILVAKSANIIFLLLFQYPVDWSLLASKKSLNMYILKKFSAILVDKESICPKIYTFDIVTRTVSNKSTLINTFQMPLVYTFCAGLSIETNICNQMTLTLTFNLDQLNKKTEPFKI